MLLAHVDRLVDVADAARVEAVLRDLLAGREPNDDGADLGAAARRVLAVAASPGPASPQTARELLAPLTDELAALSWPPERAAPALPVYLLHGEHDPVVPGEASERLAANLAAQGGDVSRVVTDLFGHVDGNGPPTLWRAWPVLRLLARFLDDADL